jgi:hypothetical protein
MKSITFLAVAIITCLNSFSQVVFTESFDGATFVPTGWTNLLVSGTNTWSRVTSGTFPTQAPRSGSAQAKFNSFNVNGGVRALVSPLINYSNRGGAATTISFWMYRDNGYNSTPDKIEVLMNTAANLTGANLLGTVNRARGLAPTVAANGWYQYSFSVPATYTTATNYLILKATSAYGNNIYIDDVSWTSYSAPSIDMMAVGLVSPSNFNCISTNQSVSIQIKNNGSVSINFAVNPVTITSSISVVATNTGLASSVTPITFVVNSGTLATGASTNVVITNSLNTSINGSYTFNAKTSVIGDVLTSNDAMTAVNVIVSKVNVLPFEADFGAVSSADFLTQQISGTGLWTNVTSGNLSNPTLTPLLNSGNGFAYFNSYSFSSGTVANLITPSFNFNAYSNPVIELWVSQDNGWTAYNDKLDILVSTDGGLTWSTSLLTIQRYNASYTTPGWKQFSVPLTLYAGSSCVRIAIKATSEFGNNMAIDYLKVRDAGSILPIKLVDFSGIKLNDTENLLSWETAEEVNTKSFEIEISTDGINFSKLHSQNAEGVQTGNTYTFVDVLENETPIVYYRLVSVDNDGSKEFFKVISIEREYSIKNNANLFPNPSSGLTYLEINSDRMNDVIIEIIDFKGGLIKTEIRNLQEGNNKLELISSLNDKGIYFVKVRNLTDEKTISVLKLVVI